MHGHSTTRLVGWHEVEQYKRHEVFYFLFFQKKESSKENRHKACRTREVIKYDHEGAVENSSKPELLPTDRMVQFSFLLTPE